MLEEVLSHWTVSGEGNLTRNAYILLMLQRQGGVDPQLVETLGDQFDKMNVNHDEVLDQRDISIVRERVRAGLELMEREEEANKSSRKDVTKVMLTRMGSQLTFKGGRSPTSGLSGTHTSEFVASNPMSSRAATTSEQHPRGAAAAGRDEGADSNADADAQTLVDHRGSAAI